MSDVTLHPVWKQAVSAFLQAGFADGDVVARDWFEQQFGMTQASGSMRLDAYQARQLTWLENIEALRRELLEKHRIYLENVYGSGYRIVPPAEQTGATKARFEREVKKEFRRAALGFKNIRHEALSDAQRQENLDAIVKLSQIASMRKALR
ncbi:hypothetical protein M1M06_07510 [Ralstonia insidiosa]|uniref:hypothetical protein n=2 Tax=Pseudomonadota TaxID=1224 RepID=UPI00200A10ED|nr:hypothetical protein [Ralstonia insidiosa]MCK8648890.1 hypothetical protein [Ralstonia insidiosa]